MNKHLNGRFIKITGVCCFAAGILIALVALNFPRELPSFRLPDGSVLRLEFVRYQGTPRVAWLRTAREWIAGKLGRPSLYHHFAPPGSLVFWFSRRDKETAKYMDFGSLSHAVAVDSHGCEFDAYGVMAVHAERFMGGARHLPKAPAGSKYILASAVLPVVPRREKTFELRLYDDRRTILGKFMVRNPLYRRYPTWKPEPLPVNGSAGDLTVSLLGLSNRWTSTYHDGLQVKRFSLTTDFRIPLDWELSDLHVEDATGNRGIVDFPFEIERILNHKLGRDREPLATRFQLCINESAWKMSATFLRTEQGQFASNELWTIPRLKIPGAGVANVLSASHTWQHTTVRLCAISGTGSFTYSNGVPVSASAGIALGGSGSGPYISVGAQKPQVMLQVSGLNEEYRFDGMARVNGKIYRCQPSSSGNDYRLLQLEIPEGTV